MSLCRDLLDALLPPGSLWVPEDDADFDLLLEGMAANSEALVTYLESLAHLRNPLLTPALADLETEFGIIPDPAMDETLRRGRLLAAKTAGNGDGSAAFMERQLRAAGFDVYVHVNNPPVNPNQFITFSSLLEFGAEEAEFGADDAEFGGTRRLLVNDGVVVGQFPLIYVNPPPQYWPLVFFVGGAATRGVGGELTGIAQADVPLSRWNELDTLIIKYKPMWTWCGLSVNYV